VYAPGGEGCGGEGNGGGRLKNTIRREGDRTENREFGELTSSHRKKRPVAPKNWENTEPHANDTRKKKSIVLPRHFPGGRAKKKKGFAL